MLAIADVFSSFRQNLFINVDIEQLMIVTTQICPDIPFYPRKGVKILGWPKLDLQTQTLQSQRQDRRLL